MEYSLINNNENKTFNKNSYNDFAQNLDSIFVNCTCSKCKNNSIWSTVGVDSNTFKCSNCSKEDFNWNNFDKWLRKIKLKKSSNTIFTEECIEDADVSLPMLKSICPRCNELNKFYTNIPYYIFKCKKCNQYFEG